MLVPLRERDLEDNTETGTLGFFSGLAMITYAFLETEAECNSLGLDLRSSPLHRRRQRQNRIDVSESLLYFDFRLRRDKAQTSPCMT